MGTPNQNPGDNSLEPARRPKFHLEHQADVPLVGAQSSELPPSGRAVKSHTGSQQQGSCLPTNANPRCLLEGRGGSLTHLLPDQMGSSSTKQTPTVREHLAQLVAWHHFFAWHHCYPFSTQGIWNALRHAILVLPTPCIPCPHPRDGFGFDGFDLSNNLYLRQKGWAVDYDCSLRMKIWCSMGGSALLRS